VLIELQPDLLKDIGCVLRPWTKRVSNRIDKALVSVNQVTPCRLIAIQA
jgi:hypothetical protein